MPNQVERRCRVGSERGGVEKNKKKKGGVCVCV